MNISFFWKNAGLVSAWSNGWTVHLFPSKKHQFWGAKDEEFYGYSRYYGLGPALLVIRPCEIDFSQGKRRRKRK